MGLFIKTSDGAWSPAVIARVKTGESTWSTVLRGFVKTASNAWSQFWPATSLTYTFSFGNTVYVGTNGYISLDTGQGTVNIASTTGRVLGILPADLVMNSVRWAADSSKFYVFWRGRRISGTNFEIEYEVHFTDGQDYALIKLVAFPSSTYSCTAYYVDGSRTGRSTVTTTRTVGAEYRVYFGTTAAFSTSFTEYGTSTHPVWLASGSVTAGSLDDGYYSIVASQGASASAPTSVTSSSIGTTSATVSWSAPSDRGMSAIQSYDYSINGGSSWTSTGLTTSATITGLNSSTSYTVLVRANNYFFTGTNYGSVTFSTLVGGPTITSLTASAPTTSSTQLVLLTVSWSSTNQASYYLNVLQTGIVNYGDYGTTETSSSQSHGSGNNFLVYSGVAVSISLTVYNGASQTGDSATSTLSYTPPIVAIPTVSGVTASSVTASSATISWSSTNQDTYSITGLPSSYTGFVETSRAVSGLSAGTTYTATVTVTSVSGHTASANVTFTTTALPNISSITLTPGGSSLPRMTATWSATNTASVYFAFYRSSSSTLNAPIDTFINSGYTNGSTVITNTGGLNFYYQILLEPWSGSSGTGSSGTARLSGVKRNTVSGGPSTYNF
jgi:hypothetical protein